MPDFKTLKKSIKEAVTIRRFVDYRDAPEYEEDIEFFFPSIEQMIRDGVAKEAIDVIEYTMKLMEKNWQKIDDSGGGMSYVFNQLQKLHLQACQDAKPNPVKLAKTLFEWAMATNYDAFHDSPKDYADVLGEKGMAELGKLIDEGYAEVEPAYPNTPWQETTGQFRIKAWARMYAEVTKDFDKLLKVMSRDLSIPYRFLEIAQACEEFKRKDLALSWAEKGMVAFSADEEDPRLRSFLAHLYADDDRIEDSFNLLWGNLERSQHRFLDAYKELKKAGEKVGLWKEWQSKALVYFERLAKKDDNSSLVVVLIYEGRLREAYEAAKAYGCRSHVWESLAATLFKPEPELAYVTYKSVFKSGMSEYASGPYGRKTVANAVKQISKLAKRIGKVDEFGIWLEEEKKAYKRRTGFLNDLKKMKL